MASSLKEKLSGLTRSLPGKPPSHKLFHERLSTGIVEMDSISECLPRGAITEIAGPRSSGRTSLAYSILATATNHLETCAWVDAADSLDANSAASAGVILSRLLWIRCEGSLERAVRATDLLLQGGGFGIVVADLGGFTPETVRRIPMNYWFRFRLALEKTPTILLVLARDLVAGSTATLSLRTDRRQPVWTGPAHYRYFDALEFRADRQKPVVARKASCLFHARSKS